MKLLKRYTALIMIICLFSASGMAEKENNKNLCGITVANEFRLEINELLTESLQNTTPLNEVTFISNNRSHSFLACNDMLILHIEHTISDPSYVTCIQIMVRKDNNSLVSTFDATEILESALKAVSKDGEHLFNRPFNTYDYWQYEGFFSTQYEITTLRYVGELPNEAINDDYLWLESVLDYPSIEEIDKNVLTLSSFLATFLPDYTVEEFLECRYVNPYLTVPSDYELQETGMQLEKYIINQDNLTIYVTLFRMVNVEDPYIFEIEIESKEHVEQEVLLLDYIHYFTLLPGTSKDIYFPLRFLLGDEVTWTELMNQRPYAKTEGWKMRFVDGNSNGFPSIRIIYVGQE